MSNRKIPFVENEYYHIYNRGNSKQKIFLDEKDYDHFVKLLYLSNTENRFRFRDDIVRVGIDSFDYDRGTTLVSIGAWVLMPNHFHLYVTPNSKNEKDIRKIGLVANYVHKLLTSYTKYFNTKYKRTGGLFEGVFKSQHVSGDNHAKYLYSYIHLNPIKLMQPDWKEAGIRDVNYALQFLQKYKYSSYLDYKDIARKEGVILNRVAFPDYFEKPKDFDKEILEWLNYREYIN